MTRAAVRSLPAEFDSKLAVRFVSHLEPEAKTIVKEMGWSNHGLLIRDENQIFYSASDHRANAFDALVALKIHLGLEMDCR